MIRAPQTLRERDDIQALLRTGFHWLPNSRYSLLRVLDPVGARAWLKDLLATGLVRSAAQVGREGKRAEKIHEAVAIAFTHRGLGALGVVETADFPFPSAFRSGMGSRSRASLLRDRQRKEWKWSDIDGMAETVDVLCAHFWAGQPSWDPLADISAGRGSVAFREIRIDGCPSYLKSTPEGPRAYEPFGFRDGVAQPSIEGLNDTVPEGVTPRVLDLYKDGQVAAGEFILGHLNQYGEPTYCPDVEGWVSQGGNSVSRRRFGMNGSYLAVRQIEQHVKAFGEFHVAFSGCPGEATIAEKMIGRRKDDAATPLVRTAGGEPKNDIEADAFRYRVDDGNGFMCPRGAHIRRSNPRDLLGHDVESGIAASKLHRLLRRGRPYRQSDPPCARQRSENGTLAPCGADAYRHSCGAGLMFIACNADLDRQFEFVLQRWLGNPRFGDQRNVADPILGSEEKRTFAMPGLPIGDVANAMHRFTTGVGGGYFFLPSIAALRFIVERPLCRATATTASVSGDLSKAE